MFDAFPASDAREDVGLFIEAIRRHEDQHGLANCL
jgi:hypothetical protein